jgi:DNA polymerase III delta prime subunit
LFLKLILKLKIFTLYIIKENMPKSSDKNITPPSSENLDKQMDIEYTYPDPSDPEFQKKIYTKREFYYHKIPGRDELKTPKDVQEYRDKICSRKFALHEHQSFLGNYINPDTPYKGVLVFHGTGTGKCLEENQLVYANGNLLPIKDIWNNYSSKKTVPDDDDPNGEWAYPIQDIVVNSMDNSTMKLKVEKVDKLYRQKIKEMINVIELDNGTRLKITKRHKLYTESGWTNDFTDAFYVLTPKKFVSVEKSIGKDLAYLLGWQISEGHERSDQLCMLIRNNDIGILKKCKQCLVNISKTENLVINNSNILYPKDRIPNLQMYSKDYVKYLEKRGYTWGKLSRNKRFPSFLMNSIQAEKRIFLKVYFDAGARVDIKNKTIEISTASEMIINQLIVLLKHFEINMIFKKKCKCMTNGTEIKRDYFCGYIRGNDLIKFNKEINFETVNKKKALAKICTFKVNCNKNPYAVNKILKEIRNYTKLPIEVFVFKEYVNTDMEPSIDKLKLIIQNLKKVVANEYELPSCNSSKLNIDICYINSKIRILEQRISGNFQYSKIVKISEEMYDGYVYDLEIKNHHNFNCPGVIVSNTCAAINIAERFKSLVQKYNTKIYVLSSGPLIKENFKSELIKCTGETYLKESDKSIYVSDAEKEKAKKNAVNIALQYYRFMSYVSFYKKVLGERIIEKVKTKDNKIKVSYRKTKEGEFERDIAIDRIYNLNNSLIIIDEAHNLTGNAYGESLKKIIKNSSNLKIVLLTATPMKNLADDIIELLNFIRPYNSPILRDRIFNSHKNHLMDFKPDGLEYLKKMSTGFISHLRGADPLTFAKRVEKGNIPKCLVFTKVISCRMLPFQRSIYDEAILEKNDTLDRRSEAVANFAFPGLSQDRKTLVGYYGREGVNIVKNQLKTHYEALNKKIAQDIFKSEDIDIEGDLIYPSESGKTISGNILKLPNLKYFSIKFYTALKKLKRLFWGKKGARTAFVYSNLVKVGIELFTEILMQNGYLEFDENQSNYKIKQDTICYFCGHTYKEHQQRKLREAHQVSRAKKKKTNGSESSTEYDMKTEDPPTHVYYPATFLPVTGKSTEESIDAVPEDKQRMIRQIFNSVENKEGKFIKLVLGSKVMNEGISLKNVSEVHILDVYFNLGKVDQVIGRAIRRCSHYDIIDEENPYPEVKVYKYAVTLEKEMSSEEELYKKAERKYILIKKVERSLKQIAIDCPLNRHGNIFPEELSIFKNCKDPYDKKKSAKDIVCPSKCDYTKCDFVCENPKLNTLYWDDKQMIYKKVKKEKLDYSTFTQTLARNEIENVKTKIKELFRVEYVYTLKDILEYVKGMYEGEKRELFDDFFVFKALFELIPITENDFNNYQDTIFDKFNRPGYLIYIKKYYIFQPFDQNDDVPMHYRSTYNKPMQNQLTLYNYLKNTTKYKEYKGISDEESEERLIIDHKLYTYDFNTTMDYYDSRDENNYVGIIDKESARRKNKRHDELADVFKIRERRDKILEKKRGTGIPSLTGAVCSTSKSREYLEDLSKDINITLVGSETRVDICDKIKDKLLFLEKYSTGKDKVTYVMIPSNHKIYTFPYNLEDRVDHIKEKIKDKIKFGLDIEVKTEKQIVNKVKNLPKFIIKIKKTSKLDDFEKFIESLGFEIGKKEFTMVLS